MLRICAATSCQQRSNLIQIRPLEFCIFGQTIIVIERNEAIAKRHHSSFAQRSQDPIDVYRAEPQCICQQILGQRAGVARLSYAGIWVMS